MKKNIKDVKMFIENFNLNTELCRPEYLAEGSGRIVAFYDKYAIKIPYGDYIESVNGCNQNLKELDVWLNTKHTNLLPILGVHMGCLITEQVETDFDSICKTLNIDFEEIETIISKKIYTLIPIVEEFDLDLNEISKLSSWGYHNELGFVCIDYGFVDYSNESFNSALCSKDDITLIDAYYLAYKISKYQHFNKEYYSSVSDKFSQNLKDLLDIKVFYSDKRLKGIFNELVKRNLAYYSRDISDIKDSILKDLPNEKVFNETLKNKANNYIFIDSLNMYIPLYSKSYNVFLEKIFKSLEYFYKETSILIKK